ncbi:MAG: deoxyguanosinetriphosphate triphosphohydrolase [Candidatus Omnitrophica bacterium]|nr:deoxyguanosinetriphosphate triphosphohydrolase [Candidatus Omnitrophota bacterium]MDD5591720.1 deoxyguanosinetriphosphate triphosphohydrolase [Candidatus Omnitrophota bacterium]
MFNQAQIKESENNLLAPYAMKSHQTKGRVYQEKEHPYRSVYQRDRDRIIHSAAFRRLEYKTQVFVNHEGDYYRTRLTHTLEVAQIARTIASALRLNADLTEAIALAHDLGHTPFGHSGEDALDELMAKYGGFNHNLHGLRVVDILEAKYPDFPGLNLTWEVREGIVKHSSAFDRSDKIKGLAPNEMPTLETQVVDIADEIAYDNHDIDDGLTSGLLKEPDLKQVGLWDKISKEISKKYAKIDSEQRKYLIIRSLIDIQVTDIIRETEKTISKLKLKSCAQVRKSDKKIIAFSSELRKIRKPLREFLMENLYRHYRVIRMSNKAKRFIQELFKTYIDNPRQLPPKIQKNIPADGVRRAVCDYIAGMTDRYALDEYKKLFDPYEKV